MHKLLHSIEEHFADVSSEHARHGDPNVNEAFVTLSAANNEKPTRHDTVTLHVPLHQTTAAAGPPHHFTHAVVHLYVRTYSVTVTVP